MFDYSAFQPFPHDGRLYLVNKLNDVSGLFSCDGLPVYGVMNPKQKKSMKISTEYLELDLGVTLSPYETTGSFPLQTFDLLRLMTEVSARELEAFVALCTTHSSNLEGQPIRDFFDSILNLFRSNNKQSKLNAIGLIGELFLIQRIAREYGIDASQYWQVDGEYSKYDFSFPEFNIEAKTTTARENIVAVKHSQLFNGDRNYLLFSHIERNPSGVTVAELAGQLKESNRCFLTLRSRVLLEAELLRVAESDLKKKYSLTDSVVFDASDIDYLGEVSERIHSLSYNLDLTGCVRTSLAELFK